MKPSNKVLWSEIWSNPVWLGAIQRKNNTGETQPFKET